MLYILKLRHLGLTVVCFLVAHEYTAVIYAPRPNPSVISCRSEYDVAFFNVHSIELQAAWVYCKSRLYWQTENLIADACSLKVGR